MTHEQINQRIKELNCGDNYKLVGYLLMHRIDVIACTPDQITVNSVYCKDGKSFIQQEAIAASMPAVRDYLGY
jgi:hypothetical protein